MIFASFKKQGTCHYITQLEKEYTLNSSRVGLVTIFKCCIFCFGNRSSVVTSFESKQISFHVLLELFMICLVGSKWDATVIERKEK